MMTGEATCSPLATRHSPPTIRHPNLSTDIPTMIKEKQCGVQFDGSKLSKKEAELEVKQELVSRILNKRAILAMSKGQVGAGVKKWKAKATAEPK